MGSDRQHKHLYGEPRGWTLRELLGQLQAVAEGAPETLDYWVLTEGCDCLGDVAAIEVENDPKTVTFCRSEMSDDSRESAQFRHVTEFYQRYYGVGSFHGDS